MIIKKGDIFDFGVIGSLCAGTADVTKVLPDGVIEYRIRYVEDGKRERTAEQLKDVRWRRLNGEEVREA